ncbi:hypothetical protein [uncultured Senegalimassilia sp.]|uniref:hypothetical protein n=1 Tax=uncultured Senegalimassilia sp. TaxID=1714350 RepID=UPI0026DFA42D|nr:hypothetical protein [uncultured Senegalimassilia sp.]
MWCALALRQTRVSMGGACADGELLSIGCFALARFAGTNRSRNGCLLKRLRIALGCCAIAAAQR